MPPRTADLETILEALADERLSVSASDLYALSDLSGEQLAAFRSAWPRIATERRRSVLRSILELAETSFEVSFDRIFIGCLEDSDPFVRATAAEGLWENESVALVGPYLNLLQTDPSPLVRAAAASGLGRFVLAGELEKIEEPIQQRIVQELLSVLHLPGEELAVRRRALESVAYACAQQVSDFLEAAYYDEEEMMRISAIVGMGRSCDRRWQAIIMEELQSETPAMRYEAALASGALGLKSAVSLLTAMMEDPDRQISYAAIWALGEIGGSAARRALLAACDDADEDMQSALDDALAEQALANGLIGLSLADPHWAADGDPESDDDEWEPVDDESTYWDDSDS